MSTSTSNQTLSGYWQQIRAEPAPPARTPGRHTKIVCTLGPSSSSAEMVLALARAGMDVARLNFSHGSHDDHAARLLAVRAAAAQLDRPIAVLADLCGPKIRVLGLESARLVEAGDSVTLRGGVGSAGTHLGVSFAGLAECVTAGDPILIDDGLVRMRVENTLGDLVTCRVEVGGRVLPNKGVNLPGTALPISSLTEKDLTDLAFALDADVDFVALSFVRRAADMTDLRQRIDGAGSHALTVAKIEKAEAVADLDAIIEASDAVMVARGDLGVEIGVSKVPLIQKRIIDQARRSGKAVITATQMLESMIDRAEPTRAEASDVANAIIDGTSAVMLSAETASGAYPLEAVTMMHTIALEVEPSLPQRHAEQMNGALPSVLAASACEIAQRIGVTVIAVPTETGSTAREVARLRPGTQVVAASSDTTVLRQLALEWGVVPIMVPVFDSAEMLWLEIVQAIEARNLAQAGETIVFTGRTELALPGQTTHVLVHRMARGGLV
jgi:pyruvate kinase